VAALLKHSSIAQRGLRPPPRTACSCWLVLRVPNPKSLLLYLCTAHRRNPYCPPQFPYLHPRLDVLQLVSQHVCLPRLARGAVQEVTNEVDNETERQVGGEKRTVWEGAGREAESR
jgi:hypothetical protein